VRRERGQLTSQRKCESSRVSACSRKLIDVQHSSTNFYRIPILDPNTGYGYFHLLVRINENFGRIDLDMPIGIVLDIPPQVTGGVSLPIRLDQWGAESAPAYRALLGLSFLWHEPGRTHAPKGGKWLWKRGLEPYEPLTDADAIDFGISEQHPCQSSPAGATSVVRAGETGRAR